MIVTVTPNPGLDLTYLLSEEAGTDSDLQRATSSTLEASGKGVNVSRALAAAGVTTCAVLPLGGATGGCLADLLAQEGVDHRVVTQRSGTRINTSMLVRAGRVAKVNGPGGPLNDSERVALLDATAQALTAAGAESADTWLAICGSLPPGVDPALVSEFVRLAHRHGARCVVDGSGEVLSAALAEADLVAPNRAELGQVSPTVRNAQTVGELAMAATAISAERGCDLLVSLGDDGALFTDGVRTWHASAAPLVPVNPAGAGDALLAGWLSGHGEASDRLRRAVRWGRSACLAEATVDCTPGVRDDAPITVRDLTPAEHRAGGSS